MRSLMGSSVLLAFALAGCSPSNTAPVFLAYDLTPTAEESEYMAHVGAESDRARSCVGFAVEDVTARGQIGAVSQTAVVLENRCATLDVPVRAFELVDIDGAFSLASEVPSVIPAGESVEILLDFEAQAEMIHLASVRLLVEDAGSPVQIAELYGVVPRDGDRSGDPPNASTGGGAFSIETGVAAILDGTYSSDPEGDALDYRWSFKSLPTDSVLRDGDITDYLSDIAEFTPDVDGDFRLRLVVSDGTSTDKTFATYAASSDGISTAPVAIGGDAQYIKTGDSVSVDGSASYDPEGEALNFEWTLSSIADGSAMTDADLGDADTDTVTFTPDIEGVYVLKLRVDDGLLSGKDFIAIHVSDNSAPVADAGADQSVALGEMVDLDGSASMDPDEDALSYSWSIDAQPSGSLLTDADIAGSDGAMASFTPDAPGTWTLMLAVDDGYAGAADTVTIEVTDDGECVDGDYSLWAFWECWDVWDFDDWWAWLSELLGL